MKNFIFTLVMLFSLTTFAQQPVDSLITEDKITETERIIDKYGGKIVDGFNNVVSTVTPIAEEGFKIAVRLQIAKGIGYLLPTIFFIILILFRTRGFNIMKWLTSLKKEQWIETPGPTFVVLGLLCYLAVCVTTLDNALLYLIAPEWFAIQDIISLVK